jgi:4'-phosphopantetheinyl transferase
VNALGHWRPGPQVPSLAIGSVHVWRVSTDPVIAAESHWRVLSPAEQVRARRLRRPADQARFVLAHGALRAVLSAYQRVAPGDLAFETSELGKPALQRRARGGRLEFSLSHSGNLALIAVTRDRAVGVDVEQWNANTELAAVAERYFSPTECEALRALAGAPERLLEGFYSAWTRKEAYLKATGHGVSRGLDHFDVSLAPGEPATLIADRKDHDAPARWTMHALAPGAGYSAALVAATPVSDVVLFDGPAPASHHASHASTNPASTSAT